MIWLAEPEFCDLTYSNESCLMRHPGRMKYDAHADAQRVHREQQPKREALEEN